MAAFMVLGKYTNEFGVQKVEPSPNRLAVGPCGAAFAESAPLPHEPRQSNVRVPCGSPSGPVRGRIAAARYDVPAFAHIALPPPAFSILSCAGPMVWPLGHIAGDRRWLLFIARQTESIP